jgi:hypothetical protein
MSVDGTRADDLTEQLQAKRWLILILIGFAQLMVTLDVTIVNIALPSAQNALHFSADNRQWVLTAYALSFGSLLLLGGKLGDLFGRKWTLVAGLGSLSPRRSAAWPSPSLCSLAHGRYRERCCSLGSARVGSRSESRSQRRSATGLGVEKLQAEWSLIQFSRPGSAFSHGSP